MPDREPSDTLDTLIPEDEETMADLPQVTPTYDHAPKTVEERLSPFHDSASIRVPTIQGMPSLASQGFAAPRLAVAEPAATQPDGPTDPQGVPALAALQTLENPEGPASWGEDLEATRTYEDEAPRPIPVVPSPSAPNIEISKSMEMQVLKMDAQGNPVPAPTEAPKVEAASPRARAAAQPTEVMLPALKRKKAREKEGSDLPLVLGLLALVLVIAGIIAVVALGVMGRLG